MDNIGSDNGLAPNMWQAIIWTNDGLIYWGIYTSLSLNELTSYFITDNISLKPILHVYERTCNYTGVYIKFSGRLSEEPFPWLMQKFPCILIFKTGQPRCQLNLSEGHIRLDLTSGRPLV